MEKILGFLHDGRWALFGFIGGAIGYLLRHDDDYRRVKPTELIVEGLGAGFVGAIVSMVAQYYHLGAPETGALVGISALIGARATMQFLREQLAERFNIGKKKAEAEDENGPVP